MKEKGYEASSLYTNTAEYKVGTYFAQNPSVFVDYRQFADMFGWGHAPEEMTYAPYVSAVRSSLIARYGAHDLLSIHGEGLVYYPGAEVGSVIYPVGWRSDLEWKGDSQAIQELQDLFATVRFATVSPNLLLAKPALSGSEYNFLHLLSKGYAKHKVVSNAALMDILKYTQNQLNVLVTYMRRDLSEATGGTWTVANRHATSERGGAMFLQHVS